MGFLSNPRRDIAPGMLATFAEVIALCTPCGRLTRPLSLGAPGCRFFYELEVEIRKIVDMNIAPEGLASAYLDACTSLEGRAS